MKGCVIMITDNCLIVEGLNGILDNVHRLENDFNAKITAIDYYKDGMYNILFDMSIEDLIRLECSLFINNVPIGNPNKL